MKQLQRLFYLTAFLLAILLYDQVHSLSFRLNPGEKKCINEEVHKDVLVVGEYKLSDVPGQRTNLVVSLRVSIVYWLYMRLAKGGLQEGSTAYNFKQKINDFKLVIVQVNTTHHNLSTHYNLILQYLVVFCMDEFSLVV